MLLSVTAITWSPSTSGWAYICPSSLVANSRPKADDWTTAGESPDSFWSQLVRKLSTPWVVWSAWAEDATRLIVVPISAAVATATTESSHVRRRLR